MPTALVRGVVTLTKDFTVCRKGAVLSPEQARILVRVLEGGGEGEGGWVADLLLCLDAETAGHGHGGL